MSGTWCWTYDETSITYDLGDGTFPDDITGYPTNPEPIGDNEFLLPSHTNIEYPAPKQDGNTFLYWVDDDGHPLTSVKCGATLTVHAIYAPGYTVIYQSGDGTFGTDLTINAVSYLLEPTEVTNCIEETQVGEPQRIYLSNINSDGSLSSTYTNSSTIVTEHNASDSYVAMSYKKPYTNSTGYLTFDYRPDGTKIEANRIRFTVKCQLANASSAIYDSVVVIASQKYASYSSVGAWQAEGYSYGDERVVFASSSHGYCRTMTTGTYEPTGSYLRLLKSISNPMSSLKSQAYGIWIEACGVWDVTRYKTTTVNQYGSYLVPTANISDAELIGWVSDETSELIDIDSLTEDTYVTAAYGYNVTFDNNDGSDATEVLPAINGNVTAPTPSAAPYMVFTGWSTERDGSGTTYEPGDVISVESSTTLFGQWHVNTRYADAYAVLTEGNELIFFRSADDYASGAGQTVTDMYGNEYTGHVYADIESNNVNSYNKLWYANRDSITSVRISENQTIKPINLSYWFYHCENLSEVDLNGLDTSSVTSMAYMFCLCPSLRSLDLSMLDTSSVTNLVLAFSSCSALTDINLTGWNTANVTTMVDMFDACSALTSLDLSMFDTGNVTDMGSLFSRCTSLSELDISSWDMDSVTNTNGMFYSCNNLSKITIGEHFSFKGGLLLPIKQNVVLTGRWINASVEDAHSVSVTELRDNYDGSATTGDFARGTYILEAVSAAYGVLDDSGTLTLFRSMNVYTDGVDKTVIDVDGNEYTGHVYTWVEARNIFGLWQSEKASIQHVRIASGQAIKPDDVSSWFANCTNLIDCDLSGLDTSAGTSMYNMFNMCSSLTSLDISTFDTSNITDMDRMFSGCNNLTEVVLGPNFSFKGNGITQTYRQAILPGVTSQTRSGMWRNASIDGAEYVTCADLRDNYDGSAIGGNYAPGRYQIEPAKSAAYAVLDSEGVLTLFRSMNEYVAGADQTVTDVDDNEYTGQIYINIEKLNSAASYAAAWDKQCASIKTVRIADNQTIKPISTAYWFSGCLNLTDCDLRGLDTSNVASMCAMFTSCTKLTSLDISMLDISSVKDMNYFVSFNYMLEELVLTGIDTSSVTNMSCMFYGDKSCVSLDVSCFDTSNVTDMSSMFKDCTGLETLDLASWETRNVTSMYNMFSGCSNLTALDLENFDLTQSPDTSKMFDKVTSLSRINLGANWRFNSTNQLPQFAYSSSTYWSGWERADGTINAILPMQLVNLFNAHPDEYAGWWEFGPYQLAVVTDDAIVMTTTKEPLNGFYSQKTFTDLNGDTFTGYVCEIGYWWLSSNRAAVTTMRVADNQTIVASSLTSWFREMPNLTSVDFTGLDLTGATDFDNHATSGLSSCSKLTSFTIDENFRFVTVNATSMYAESCLPSTISDTWELADGSLMSQQTIDIANGLRSENRAAYAGTWVPSSTAYAIKVGDDLVFTRLRAKLTNKTSGTYTDIAGNTYTGTVYTGIEDATRTSYPNWSNSQATKAYVAPGVTIYPQTLSYLFANAYYDTPSLTEINLSGFDISPSAAADMTLMFYGQKKIASLDLSNIDFTQAANMNGVFLECSTLTSITWPNDMTTPSLTNLSQTFSGCSSMETIDLSGFDTSDVTSMRLMFYNCTSLTSVDLSDCDGSSLDENTSTTTEPLTYIFAGCTSLERIVLNPSLQFLKSKDVLPVGTYWRNEDNSLRFRNSYDFQSKFDTAPDVWGVTWIKETETPVEVCMYAGEGYFEDAEMFVPTYVNDSTTPTYWSIRLAPGDALPGTADSTLPAPLRSDRIFTKWKMRMYPFDEITNVPAGVTYIEICPEWDGLPTAGTAYAVLTDDGDLVFFRSFEEYDYNTSRSVTDIHGVTRTGNIYTGIETLTRDDYDNTRAWLWQNQTAKIKRIYIADDTIIAPVSMYRWGVLYDDSGTDLSVDYTGLDTSHVTDMGFAFGAGYLTVSRHLTKFVLPDDFDTSNVTNMEGMFSHCDFDADALDNILAQMDTSQVTTMSRMFQCVQAATAIDVRQLDTSNVTDMSYMFYMCAAVKSLDLSQFDTHNVTNMDSMFMGCSSIEKLDTTNFDTSKVSNMSGIFAAMTSLKEIDISSFDTQALTDEFSGGGRILTFANTLNLERITIGPNSKWTTLMGPSYNLHTSGGHLAWPSDDWRTSTSYSSQTLSDVWKKEDGLLGTWTRGDLNGFCNEGNIGSSYPDVSANQWAGTWVRGAVTYICLDSKDNAVIFQSTDKWNSESNETQRSMTDIAGATHTGKIEVVRDYTIETWRYDTKDTRLGFLGKDGRATTYTTNPSIRALGLGTVSLTAKTVSVAPGSIYTPATMSAMFRNWHSLESVDFTGFDISNVLVADYLFYDSGIKEINWGGIDTANIIDASYMFYDCSKLEHLDLSEWKTNADANQRRMFVGCSNLSEVELGENFQFGTNLAGANANELPTPPTNDSYAGTWVKHLDDETLDTATYTPTALAHDWYAAANPATAGTYVWAPVYMLEFDLDGGAASSPWPTSYSHGESLVLPGTVGSSYAMPTKYGYDFAGWIDEDGNDITEIPVTSTGRRTLTATWTTVNVTFTIPTAINYVIKSDGSLIGPTNASIVNTTPLPIRINAIECSAADGWNLMSDVSTSSLPDSIALGIGPAGHLEDMADHSPKADVGELDAWEMSAASTSDTDDELPLIAEGHVANLTKDVTTATEAATIRWFAELVPNA